MKRLAHADELGVDAFNSLPDADAYCRECSRANRDNCGAIIETEPKQANNTVDDGRNGESHQYPRIQKYFSFSRKSHDRTCCNTKHHGEDEPQSNAQQGLIEMIKGLARHNVLSHCFEN